MKQPVRLLSVILVSATLALTGCGAQATGTCESCWRERPLYEVTITASGKVDGEKISETEQGALCKDCLDEAKEFAKELGDELGVKVKVSSHKKKQ